MRKLKLAALLAAVIVGIGLYRFLEELKKPQETPHTTVVVAAVDIPEDTQITKEMVTLKSISNDSLLDHYILDTESVIGMVMTSDVYAGEQIVRDRLVLVGETGTESKTLAYTVEPGMRAITIGVLQDTGLESFLKPGNRVDVVTSYTYEKTRPVLNKEKELEWVKEIQSQMLAQNVSILAVGTTMGKNGMAEYATVTLEVTPEDALNISAVSGWGNLRLLLRSPLDEEILQTELVNQKTVYAEGGGE